MKAVKFVKKIRNYAIASFLVPLIAINSCLLIYKYFGNINIKLYNNYNWDKVEHTYTYNEHDQISNNPETVTFTNCPKYQFESFWTLDDNQTQPNIKKNEKILEELIKNNKIKSITFKSGKDLNYKCVKKSSIHIFTVNKK